MIGREIDSTVEHLDRVRRELLETDDVLDVAIVTWRRRDPREGGESQETFTTNSARLTSVLELLKGGL